MTRLSALNKCPLTDPIPATRPSAGVFFRSVSISKRVCCRATVSGQYSLNVPRSTNRAILSRIMRYPNECLLATAAGRLSSSVKACRSIFSCKSERIKSGSSFGGAIILEFEPSNLSMNNMGHPLVTTSPTDIFTARTIPLKSAVITCSIFIASMTITGCPRLTVSPSLTSIATIVP